MRDQPDQRNAGSPVPPPPGDAEAITLLEDLLQRARAGEITAAAVVCQTADHGVATAWTLGASGSVFTLLGGVAELQHRLLTEQLEQPGDDTDEG